jgi:ribosomal subunit interface protein
MDHSDAIERYAKEKIEKLHKFFKKENPDSVFISMTLESHRTKHYFIAELKIKTAQYDLIAKKEGGEMYPMIDQAVHTMEKEIARTKEKHVSGKKHGAVVRDL